MNDDWLKRLHHNGHAELISRIRAQYRRKQNRRDVQPLVSLLNRQEIMMITRLDRYYADLAKRLQKEFAANGEAGLDSVFTNSKDELNELLLTSNTETAGVAGNWQALRLEKSENPNIRIKRFHETVEDHLEQFLFQSALASAAIVLATDRANAALILSRGIEAGLSTQEISLNLQSAFAGRLGKVSATRIARTEIGIAGSKGQNEGAKIVGTESKVWIAVDDDRTRGHHREVNGSRVKIDDFFTPLGENMDHPHDTQHGASARNFVNCRCVALYD